MPARKKTNPPGTYHLHRQRQRRRILEAAKELFDERGIDRTTMADIISASELRPSTMYQYFSKKEDIVWAILGEMMAEDAARAKQSFAGATTGLSKITGLLQYMADDLAQNEAKIRFMAQFDAMYARHWPAERLITLEGQIHDQGFKLFGTLIREGMADGSLRSDLDPGLSMHAVINAVIAAQRRFASLGKKVELEYGQPIDRLFSETIRIILAGLRTREPAKPTEPSPRRKAHKSTPRKRSS
jgi:AcrR family transcriptional regulator